jgi:glycosyltransferase involved in cell wall biosynthesis
VSSWIRERGLPVLVMGHVFEAAIVDDVTRLMDGAGHPTFLGRDEDFELMASLLAHSRLYLGNDTGPMHMAAACGVPVVAIFGGGHWPRFLPAAETGAAHTQELGCFGCAWGPCVFGDAPCVGEVAEDAVRESVARVLDGRSGFQVRAQPPMPEEEVRARPLQRYHAATAEAARQIQGLVAPGAAEQVRAAFRACDEAVRRIALQAQRVDAERDSHEARAARQDAVIRGQVEEIVRLDAVSRRAPLVSVVTPTLNAARFLERCIASVLRQDYGRVEHIVVDGGSTDGTLDICSRHPHLVVCSATDRGRAEALNRGFAMARGDVFGWLGAGDEYLPRAISIAVDTILEGHDAVVGLCQLVDDEGRRVGPHPGNPTDDLDPRSLRRLQEAPEQAIFWRRRLWERAGPLQVGAPRTDLWLRMGRITRLHRIGADLAACRVRPGPGATAVKSKPARSRPLRLALFGARATGSTGERLVRRTAEALLARGHDARLYVRDAMPEEERPHYLRLLPDLPLLRRAEASFRYRTGLDDLFHPGTALLRFLPWLSSADVWHFHDLHGHYVSLPALAAASWTKPVLISPRDELLTTGRMKRASLRASRFRYLVHTRNLEVHHRAALPHASIRRLTHGVDVHAYRPVPRGDALRAVGLPDDGRLVAGAIPADVTDPRNGVSEALAALRSLASRHPGRLRLLLAGEGGQTLASPGDEDLDVRYVGVVKRDSDMAMLLGCCDVLVRPTRAEGPAFACLEALACGVPVVGYDCGGQREVVGDGVGGLLVAPEPGALAAAIERLMGDPALRLRLAAGARETAVRDFDLDRYVDELVGCYEELARRRPFNDGARNKSS